MTVRELIAHGGPQPLPTRAAPSLVRALRVARGSPPWTPWTILCRLEDRPAGSASIRETSRRRLFGKGASLPSVESCRRRGLLYPHFRLITIVRIDDHLRPE